MLNYNKIESLINSGDLNLRKVSLAVNIGYSSLDYKMKNQSLRPDDVLLLSDYFQKPLEWFFDREKESGVMVVEEPVVCYGCKSCRDKERIITALEENILHLKDKNHDLQEKLGMVNFDEIGKAG